MGDQYLIYGLRDPRTGEIRYVGQSSRGMERPLEHCPPPKSDPTYKAHWLRKLLRLGLSVEIVVLEICASKDDLSPREMWWIAIGRAALGNRFTNGTAGGDGSTAPTPEVLAKRGAAIRAVKNRPDMKARIRAIAKEVSNRPEVQKKKSVGMREAWKKPGYAESHNASLKAALNRPDVVAKRSAAAKAAHARPDVKERHRAALIAAAARRDPLDRPGIILVEHDGRKQCLAAWARELNIARTTLQRKLVGGATIASLIRRAVCAPTMRINLLPAPAAD